MAQTWHTKIQPSPGKGVGIFTTENIARGTLLAIEQPVCILEEKHEALTEEDVRQGLKDLSQKQQDEFMSLAVGGKTSRSPLIRRFRANCFNYTMPPGTVCICLHMSRFNHSCVPNATWAINGDSGAFEVRTLQAISAGKEISICYMADLNTTMTFQERKKEISNAWGFACGCLACKPGEFRRCSDMRRFIHAHLMSGIKAANISAEQKTWYWFLVANLLIAEGTEDMQLAAAWIGASDTLFYRLTEKLRAISQGLVPNIERAVLAAVVANIREWKVKALDIIETLDKSSHCTGYVRQQREEVGRLIM